MEYIWGQFNSEIYLYTLNIPILYTQAAEAFKIRFQDLTVTLIVFWTADVIQVQLLQRKYEKDFWLFKLEISFVFLIYQFRYHGFGEASSLITKPKKCFNFPNLFLE
jgi:hypothetical protein